MLALGASVMLALGASAFPAVNSSLVPRGVRFDNATLTAERVAFAERLHAGWMAAVGSEEAQEVEVTCGQYGNICNPGRPQCCPEWECRRCGPKEPGAWSCH